MKSILLAAFAFAAMQSNADISVRCTDGVNNPCVPRIEAAMTQMGCTAEVVSCSQSIELGGDYCKVVSTNCSEPHAEMFGFNADAVQCWGGEAKRIRDIDSGLSLAWTMGMIRDYVTLVCVH